MNTADNISQRIVDAVLSKKLQPGARLGEQQLATVFDCSRTLVREALTGLAVRGIVTVSARRGWYLAELSAAAAREAFEARWVLETGLLRRMPRPDAAALGRLLAHLQRQQAALQGPDVGLRSYLLGDFHVCLAQCLGNSVLVDTLRDYTARTTLVAMRHQSQHDAAQSFAEHQQIVAALQAGDMAAAEQQMGQHLATWEDKLPLPACTDPIAQLRQALQPVDQMAPTLHTSSSTPPHRRRSASSPRP